MNSPLSIDDTISSEGVKSAPYRLIRKGITFLSGATAHKGILTLADQVVASATNFLTGVIIGRSCIKEEFGLYMLGFSVVLFVINIQTSLISTPYTVYSQRVKSFELTQYTGSTLIHQLGLSALSVISLMLGGVVLSLGVGSKGISKVVWVLAVVITFILLREYSRRLCFARLRMSMALLLDSCVAVLQIGGLLLLAHLGLLSASHAYWIVGVACGFTSIAWLVQRRRAFNVSPYQTLRDFGRNWSFGKWLFAGGFVYTASIQLYPWLLAGFHGMAATGVLAACMGVLFLVNPFLIGISNFLGPKTARLYTQGGAEKLGRFTANATVLLSIVMGAFCVAMLIFGNSVLVFMYGDKYGGHGMVVGILALSQLASALTFPINSSLLAMERPDVGFKSYLLALSLTVTLGLWLVKSFGIVGVALGLLTGNLIASTFRWIAFRNHIINVCVRGNR